MNTVAIDYIWRVILESERSDEVQFTDDELQVKREAARLEQQRRVQPGAADREEIADAAISAVLSAPD